MKKIIITTTLFIISLAAICQSQKHKKIRFIATMTTIKGESSRAYIHSYSDTGLFLTDVPVSVNTNTLSGYRAKWFDYGDIEKIVVHRKNSAGRGAWIGAISGAVAGALTGLAAYKRPEANSNPGLGGLNLQLDFGPGANAFGGAILGAATGALIGAGIGLLIKRTFHIHGDKKVFSMLVNDLNRRTR